MERRSVMAHVYFTFKAIAWAWGFIFCIGTIGIICMLTLPLLFINVPLSSRAVATICSVVALVMMCGVGTYLSRPTMPGYFSTRARFAFLAIRLAIPFLWAAAGWVIMSYFRFPRFDEDGLRFYWALSLPLSYGLVGFFTRYLPWSRAVHEAFSDLPPASHGTR